MKLPIANCRLPIDRYSGGAASSLASAGGAHGVTRPAHSIVNRKSQIENGFTMVEIAICLAIIGIALVAIIGVLPIGINAQKDNRQETLVNQDATVFMNAIRNGARGMDDLTNYVYAIAITNRAGFNFGYVNPGLAPKMNFSETRSFPTVPLANWYPILTNGANIIGLLSTPKYTLDGVDVPTIFGTSSTLNGVPVPNLIYGGVSNQVVALVRSLSGPAVEQPPQTNDVIVGGSFGYKLICDNAPVAVDTNLFYQHLLWDGGSYTPSARVSYILNGQLTFWQAATNTTANDIPGQSPLWIGTRPYGLEITANLRELRLTFLWPLLPNGGTGSGRHTFGTTVAGRIIQTGIYNLNNQWLYFFQPQSFTATP